jgi:hypothetical protein
MAHIKEPKGVDFVIKSEALTDADQSIFCAAPCAATQHSATQLPTHILD